MIVKDKNRIYYKNINRRKTLFIVAFCLFFAFFLGTLVLLLNNTYKEATISYMLADDKDVTINNIDSSLGFIISLVSLVITCVSMIISMVIYFLNLLNKRKDNLFRMYDIYNSITANKTYINTWSFIECSLINRNKITSSNMLFKDILESFSIDEKSFIEYFGFNISKLDTLCVTIDLYGNKYDAEILDCISKHYEFLLLLISLNYCDKKTNDYYNIFMFLNKPRKQVRRYFV